MEMGTCSPPIFNSWFRFESDLKVGSLKVSVVPPISSTRAEGVLLLSSKDKLSSPEQSPTDSGPSSLPALSFTTPPSLTNQMMPTCSTSHFSTATSFNSDHSSSATSSSGGSSPQSTPKRSKSNGSSHLQSAAAAAAMGASGTSPKSVPLKAFDDEGVNWLIDESEVKVGGVVGVGQSALIHEATWRGQRVAVKFMKQKADKKTIENFQRECQLLMSVRTPQIVFFYGAAIIDSSLCLLLEYCARGSLEDYMKDHANEFTWEKFFTFARQATEGLLVLHNWKPAIVHRDFKGQNLLVCSNLFFNSLQFFALRFFHFCFVCLCSLQLTENWQIKVSDFGLSRILDNSDTLNKVRGSYSFICPEVYYGKPFTEKSDVYSLSIVLWEMLMCVVRREYTLPYQFGPLADVVMDFQILPAVAQRGVRPIIPDSFPGGMSTLLQQMWDSQPAKRPTAGVVLETLNRLEETYMSNKHSWDRLRKKHKKERFPKGISD